MSKKGKAILLECIDKALADKNLSEVDQLKNLHEMVAKREFNIMPDHYDGSKARIRQLTSLRYDFENRQLNLLTHSDDEAQTKLKLIDDQIKKYEDEYKDQVETKEYLKLAMNEIKVEYTILGLVK